MSCGLMNEPRDAATADAFLGGRLRLHQPASGHRSGHDAILLAASVPARSGDRIVDFGAGVGVAGLAVARRVPGVSMLLVERDVELAGLAAANAAFNAIAADTLLLDVTAGAAAFERFGLRPGSVDAVMMNPPFNDATRQQRSPDTARASAHVATPTTLADWVHAARRILKPRGSLTLIWRADGVSEVLAALARGFGSIALQPVHGRVSSPAIRILVRAVKGGRAPTQIYPGLLLNDSAGVPTREAQAVLLNGEALPLASLRIGGY
jgi:tRNA1(Val) A37 N6-methylase TrmN6